MYGTFVTTRKIEFYLPDDVKEEIRGIIFRQPMFWVEWFTFVLGAFFGIIVYIVLPLLFLAEYLNISTLNMFSISVFHVLWNLNESETLVCLWLFVMLCMNARWPSSKCDVYEKYFSWEVEKRYASVLQEYVTLGKLFENKIKETGLSPRDCDKLGADDESTIKYYLRIALPPYSPPEHIRKVVKLFKQCTDKDGFESVKYLLKQRGIKMEDIYLDE